MSVKFDPKSEAQKECEDPLTNPSFDRSTVPIISYSRQLRRGSRNTSCTNPDTPYLFWDESRNKYCCSRDLQEVDIVLDKIENSIQRQVENTCSQQLYNKYIPYINDLIASYMLIYTNKLRPLVSEDELANLLEAKRRELTELSTYREGHHESCSDNPVDLGEDDLELMENLRLAQQNAPRVTSNNFFDRRGGRILQKKSKKQTKNSKYRKSAKRYN